MAVSAPERSLSVLTELSAREIQVLDLVAAGKSNKDVGEALGLSALTVKSHLARIARKLETGDRAEMAAMLGRSRPHSASWANQRLSSARLTVREYQVAAGAATGLNNADIGRAHHISEDTVKTHMRRLLRKLGVCDRAAVAYVVGCSNAAVQVLPAPPTHNYDQLERQLKASWTDADMIVLLYHLAGLPNERIAQVLHCTASTTARYAARLRADVPATTTLAMVGRALLTINPTRFRPHVLACLPQAYAGMRYDTLEPGDQQLAVWLSYGVNVNNVAGIMHMNPYLCQARVAFMVQYLALWTPEQLALAAVLADQ